MKHFSTSLLHTAWTAEEKEQLDDLIAFVETYNGDNFLADACLRLYQILELDYFFIGLQAPDSLVHTVVVVHQGKVSPNFQYFYPNSPCAQVLGQDLYYIPFGVQSIFPGIKILEDMGAESYLGTPLFDNQDQPLGLLVLLHAKLIERGGFVEALLNVLVPRLELELFFIREQAGHFVQNAVYPK